MPKKGNGLDLANDYLRQILDLTGKQVEKLDSVARELAGVKQEVAGVKQEVASVKQEVAGVKQEVAGVKRELVIMKAQQEEHSAILRKLATFIAEDREKQNREIQEIKRRVELLEQKAA
ncbi:MAG: hypothetical protein HYT87_08535 [Nitrospirae bacterium]|nr:hypothetical protein [Nitrospirota bacterium]